MSSNISWSAFIYTRTESTDYRTIVIPDDFTEEKKKWVMDHIQEVKTAITQSSSPGKLLQRVFLSDRQHYVFGVLCHLKKILSENERKDLAEKYLSQAEEKAKDITTDKNGRNIPYTFLGYVIKRTSDLPVLQPIRFDLEIFKPLCEHICQKWLEEIQNPPTLLQYNIEESPEWLIKPRSKRDKLPSLNTNYQKIALHPGAESYTQQLWTAAALCDKPQTLWIGQLHENRNPESILVSSFPKKRTLLESNFMNVALPNIGNQKIYDKPNSITNPEPTDDTQGGNILDICNELLAFLIKESQKLTGIFSHNPDEFKEMIRSLRKMIEDFQDAERKKDEEKNQEIAKLNLEVSELRDRIKKLEGEHTKKLAEKKPE